MENTLQLNFMTLQINIRKCRNQNKIFSIIKFQRKKLISYFLFLNILIFERKESDIE